MATDIAFALGVLAILGNRIPSSLKVFVVAFAVIDDLGAIVIIAALYTAELSVWYLVGGLAVLALLLTLNRLFRIMSLVPYLFGGAVMWFLMLTDETVKVCAYNFSPKGHIPRKIGDYREHATHYLMVGSVTIAEP